MKTFYIILIFLNLIFAGFKPYTITGIVTEIVNGNSFKIVINNVEIVVKLYGIYAPEKFQFYGIDSKSELQNWILDKTVTVDVSGKDQYGRLVGTVYCDYANINWIMVSTGSAWWYKAYAPNDTVLKRLQFEAKEAKRGLWQFPNPIAPWNFKN